MIQPASRYDSLDFWRGIACLSVAAYHSTPYAFASQPERFESAERSLCDSLLLGVGQLWLSVMVFFVISGYCIATIADKHRQKSRGIGSYFHRRIRRIYPPYWVCFLIWCAAITAVERVVPGYLSDGVASVTLPATLYWQQWVGNLTLTEIWRPLLFGPESSSGVLGVMWSLCYEEQFYLVVGLLILICPRYFFHGTLLITAWVYLNTWDIHPHIFGLSRVTKQLEAVQLKQYGVFWDGAWLYFAVGIAVYYWIHHAKTVGRVVIPLAMAIAVFPSLLPLENFGQFYSGQKARLTTVIFGWMLMGLHRFDSTLARAAILTPVSRCGTMCYSLYLVHWPVVKPLSKWLFHSGVTSSWATLIITIPLCVGTSVMVAWLFYECVEKRFLNKPLFVAAS